jgi:hypothetical protein
LSQWHRWIVRIATPANEDSAVLITPEVFRRVNPVVGKNGHQKYCDSRRLVCVPQSHSLSLFYSRYKLHKLVSQSKEEHTFAALLGEGRYTLRLNFEMGAAAEFMSISALECIGFPMEIGIVRMYPGKSSYICCDDMLVFDLCGR